MLYVSLAINDKLISVYGIRRMRPENPTKSTRCHYAVQDDEGNELGTLTHRYGDGAERLAAKVLTRFSKKFLP